MSGGPGALQHAISSTREAFEKSDKFSSAAFISPKGTVMRTFSSCIVLRSWRLWRSCRNDPRPTYAKWRLSFVNWVERPLKVCCKHFSLINKIRKRFVCILVPVRLFSFAPCQPPVIDNSDDDDEELAPKLRSRTCESPPPGQQRSPLADRTKYCPSKFLCLYVLFAVLMNPLLRNSGLICSILFSLS